MAFSLLGFASTLAHMATHLREARHEALEEACIVVEREAKRVIGTYDYGWPQLAQSTQEGRVRAGFSANEPLLRTGEMRDSIQHASSPDRGVVGSNNMKAVWQELGTRSIPPRSFLAGALIHEREEVVRIVGRRVRGYLVSGGERLGRVL